MNAFLSSKTGTTLTAMLCFVLSLLIASPALALPPEPAKSPDPLIEIWHVPQPDIQGAHPELGEVICYSTESFKVLLDLDIDHQDALADLRDLTLQLKLSKESLEDSKGVVEHTEHQFRLMRAEKNRVTDLWKKDNKAKHVAETRSMWDDWMTYALIVVGTVAVAEGVVIYSTAGK